MGEYVTSLNISITYGNATDHDTLSNTHVSSLALRARSAAQYIRTIRAKEARRSRAVRLPMSSGTSVLSLVNMGEP